MKRQIINFRNKTTLLKTLLLGLALGFTVDTIQAQVTIGTGTSPDNNALLDLKENPSGTSTKGLLLPRVALTGTANTTPLSAHVAGMAVYNTATAGDVTPGYYYNDGSKWVRIANEGVTGTSGAEPWFSTATGTGSTANTDSVYIIGRVLVGTNTPAMVASGASGSNPLQQKAYFTVAGGDANINGLTVGKGGGQATLSTAIGYQTLSNNTTGTGNVATGYWALANNTTANYNTATGYKALYSNTEGAGNTATGTATLRNNTTGTNNEAFGYGALMFNTTGNYNTAIGTTSLGSNTSGEKNVAIGNSALANNDNGYENTAVGVSTLQKNKTGSSNVAVGVAALYYNTDGSSNVAVGYQAAQYTTGVQNTALGKDALYSNTTGNSNTALGFNALNKMGTGNRNIALGYNASVNQSSGNSNIAIGDSVDVVNLAGSNQLNIGNTIFGSGVNTATVGAGNIGIGVTAPVEKLEVSGTTKANNYITPVQTLSGNVITWNMDFGATANWTLGAGANTLSITNMKPGMYGTIIVTNSGNSTIAFAGGSNKVINGGGGVPTLTPIAGAVDVLSFLYDGVTFWWTVGNNYN